MSNRVFIEITEASVGEDAGFDVCVSDDWKAAPAVFVSQTQLDAVGGTRVGRASEPGRRDAVGLAAWCMRNDGEACDILQAAIDNEDDIDTSWDSIEPTDLVQRLASWDADAQCQALESHTAPAVGARHGQRM